MQAFTSKDLVTLWNNGEYENFIYVVAQLSKAEVNGLVKNFRALGATDLADIVEEWNSKRTTLEEFISR